MSKKIKVELTEDEFDALKFTLNYGRGEMARRASKHNIRQPVHDISAGERSLIKAHLPVANDLAYRLNGWGEE